MTLRKKNKFDYFLYIYIPPPCFITYYKTANEKLAM